MRRILPKLLAVAILSLSAVFARAEVSRVTLVDGWTLDNGNRMIGVRIDMDPGWKTYWRAPGGNGIPPQFDFSRSRNLGDTRVYWPRPSIFHDYGVRTIGYRDSVVFPVELTPQRPGSPITLDLNLFYGVCEEVCIPAEARLTGDLAAGDIAGRDAIQAALDIRALTAAEAGVTGIVCRLRPSNDRYDLTAEVSYSGTPDAEAVAVFETGSELIFITPTATQADTRTLRIAAVLDYYGDGMLALDRSAIRLNLLAPSRSIEISGCPAP